MAMVFQHFNEATNRCPHCGYDAGGAIDREIEWFVFNTPRRWSQQY